MKNNLLVKRTDKGFGESPLHAPKKDGDVGYDLTVSEDTIIMPAAMNGSGFATSVPCAVKVKIPDGYFCQVLGRSSAANKRGILVHTAVIDNGYTGQMFACCWNMGKTAITVKAGERLAQLVFFPMTVLELQEVEELPETSRGESGFGSTGA